MNASYLENFQIDVVKYARVTAPRTKRIKRVDTSSQRALYVGTTSEFSLEQRHDLISTTSQRCSNVRFPLGPVVTLF